MTETTWRSPTDAQIVAGVRAASAAWHAHQDTVYFRERFGYRSTTTFHARLLRLAAAGLLIRHVGSGWLMQADTWEAARVAKKWLPRKLHPSLARPTYSAAQPGPHGWPPIYCHRTAPR